MSTPKECTGKSRICPAEASTLYLPFKYFEIVFALEGDSTIIKSIYKPSYFIIFFDVVGYGIFALTDKR